MVRASVLLLAAGLLLGAPSPGRVLQAQSTLEEVTRVRFRGNLRFSDKVLRTAIITRETDCRSPILLPFCWAGREFSLDPYYFHAREFRRDMDRLRAFYYQRGYRYMTVDTATARPQEGRVEVTFLIEEGEPVRVAELGFSGTEDMPDSPVMGELPIEVGDPLNTLLMEAARDTLAARLKDRGYAHAEVLQNYVIPQASPLEATVSYDLYPGPAATIGSVSVIGNVTVSEQVIRRMLPFREGRPYSETQVLDGQRNLYNLDIFTFAAITPVLDHMPDSIVPLMAQVTEGDVHRVRAGAGFSTEDCVNTEARWASRNFLGGARRLQITGRLSKILAPFLEQSLCPQAGEGEYGELNWLLSADFSQPWLGSPRNTLNASIIGERESYPGTFIREALSLNVGLTHALQPSTAATLFYRPEISRLDAAELYFCVAFLLCTPEDISVLQGANWLAPMGFRLSRDRRNQVLSPTRGHALVLDVEGAAGWTGSDFPYTRVLGEGSWYKETDGRWVIGTRLRGGWVSAGAFRGLGGGGSNREIVHPQKRLYAGGANSVRGFAQNRLGPGVLYVRDVQDILEYQVEGTPLCAPEEVMDLTCDVGPLPEDRLLPRPSGGTALLEGSLELRFPITGEQWEGATFLDFGQVWDHPSGFDLGELEFTPGLGVRYFSPIGPIRVDLAYRFDPGGRYRVVTPQIRPFDPAVDEEADKIILGEVAIPFVPSDDLALLGPRVSWGDEKPWSLRRFQLHLTIGQAF